MRRGIGFLGLVFGLMLLARVTPSYALFGLPSLRKAAPPSTATVQTVLQSTTAKSSATSGKKSTKSSAVSQAAVPKTRVVKKQVCKTVVVKKKRQNVCRTVSETVPVANIVKAKVVKKSVCETVIVKKKKKKVCRTVTETILPPLRAKWRNNNLSFGITVHPNGQYGLVADDQIGLMQELGVKYVKYDFQNRLGSEENDVYINKLIAAGLTPVVVIDWKSQDHSPTNSPESEQFGYDIAKEIAARYLGKVKHYQVAAEIENHSLITPTHNGITTDQYDLRKFDELLPWVRGTLRGIKEGSPAADRIMSSHYTHVGFLDLLRDRAKIDNFEIIGWNIYSDQGTELERIQVGDGYFDLLSSLVGRGKSIWLTEVSRRYGAHDGELPQRDYLNTLYGYAKETPEIAAFFPYELGDQPANTATKEDRYGLVHWDIDETTGRMVNIDRREAFSAYQDRIADFAAGK